MNLFIFVLSFIVVGLRFTVPSHGLSWPGTYEAFAHFWCGILLAWCFQELDPKTLWYLRTLNQDTRWERFKEGFCQNIAPILTLFAITAFEGVMFFSQ